MLLDFFSLFGPQAGMEDPFFFFGGINSYFLSVVIGKCRSLLPGEREFFSLYLFLSSLLAGVSITKR